MGDERKPWEEEDGCAEDSLSRDMSRGQMSEMREEELVLDRHMRAAFSGGLVLGKGREEARSSRTGLDHSGRFMKGEKGQTWSFVPRWCFPLI